MSCSCKNFFLFFFFLFPPCPWGPVFFLPLSSRESFDGTLARSLSLPSFASDLIARRPHRRSLVLKAMGKALKLRLVSYIWCVSAVFFFTSCSSLVQPFGLLRGSGGLGDGFRGDFGDSKVLRPPEGAAIGSRMGAVGGLEIDSLSKMAVSTAAPSPVSGADGLVSGKVDAGRSSERVSCGAEHGS